MLEALGSVPSTKEIKEHFFYPHLPKVSLCLQDRKCVFTDIFLFFLEELLSFHLPHYVYISLRFQL
jgi:hypothetical protein